MLTRTRWQIIGAFAILTLAILGVLYLVFGLTECRSSYSCVVYVLAAAGLAATAGGVAISWIAVERAQKPIRDLRGIVARLADGDRRARILPHRSDDSGAFIAAFNSLIDRQFAQIDSLTAERQHFATLLEYMADGVMITDERGLVTLINPAACRLLATTEEEALNRSLAVVVRHHQLIQLWQRSREEGTEQVETIELGPDQFLQAVITPYAREGTAGSLLIFQDLTQVRRLQTMRRDFISNLSHELRTPLASLRAVVETLQDGALNDPEATLRFLEHAGHETDVMTQMVDEMTELSAIESGQVRLRLSETAVSELISRPLERLRPQAERAELTVSVDLAPDLSHVLADSDRIQQVITNLLHNAIKFTPPGGTIDISAGSDPKNPSPDDWIVIKISDTGIGIPRNELPRIFERFYKSDPARTRGQSGTGLGLAIARHIIQIHGGVLDVRSKQGKGSTFFFTLPVYSDMV